MIRTARRVWRIATSNPVFVHQMGKVGSQGIVATLNTAGLPAIHAHSLGDLQPDEIRIIRFRRSLRLPLRVICPIREPIGRNISALFENWQRNSGEAFSDNERTIGEVCDLFLDRYPHHTPLEWFDRHLLPVFGVDVYSHPFPRAGWDVYRNRNTRVLVYRCDLDRDQQCDVLSSFLGVNIHSLVSANVGESKEYGEFYRDFVDQVRLPEIYVRLMLESRYCRHFWTETERALLMDRWCSTARTARQTQ